MGIPFGRWRSSLDELEIVPVAVGYMLTSIAEARPEWAASHQSVSDFAFTADGVDKLTCSTVCRTARYLIDDVWRETTRQDEVEPVSHPEPQVARPD